MPALHALRLDRLPFGAGVPRPGTGVGKRIHAEGAAVESAAVAADRLVAGVFVARGAARHQRVAHQALRDRERRGVDEEAEAGRAADEELDQRFLFRQRGQRDVGLLEVALLLLALPVALAARAAALPVDALLDFVGRPARRALQAARRRARTGRPPARRARRASGEVPGKRRAHFGRDGDAGAVIRVVDADRQAGALLQGAAHSRVELEAQEVHRRGLLLVLA